MSTTRQDRGAALIVAIVFVVMIGTIGAGLAGLITSSSNNRVTLQELRDREYAADGAIEHAIAAVRALGRASSASCSAPAGTSTSTVNGLPMHVDWRVACSVVRGGDGAIVAQRDVVFEACDDTGVACAHDAIVMRAEVNFRDAPDGSVGGTSVQSWSVDA